METEIVPVATTKTPSIINWNYESIKSNLENFLNKYDGYVVSEDTLTDDKKTRAELNKVSKSIDEFRKTIKKEVLKPVDIFEDQCRELSGMVDDVSSKIDKNVKVFEDRIKEEKRNTAKEIISDLLKDSGLPKEYYPKVEFKESFTNLTTTKKSVQDDVSSQIEILKAQNKQFEEDKKIIVIAIDNANKNLITQLFVEDYINQLQYKSVSEIITIINSRVETIKEQEKKSSEIKKEVIIPEVKVSEEKEEETVITLEITATKLQFRALKEFFVINKINYIKK